MKQLFFFVFLLSSLESLAQQPTDIWMFDLDGDKLVSEPFKITDRAGYDNQPSISGDIVYYTSQREEQTDIYAFDLVSETTRRVTFSNESEYSPLQTPDGKHISVIMVEKDGTQRLWQYSLTKRERKPILLDLKPVGYHVWYGPFDLALFVLGEPNKLYTANSYNGLTEERVESIGRSLQVFPGEQGKFSFIKKNDDGNFVASYEKEESKRLIDLPDGTEDISWLNDSTVITGVGSRLMKGDLSTNTWSEISNLEDYGVSDISRIAISADRKVLVIVISRE